jgi:hypothetical protein
MAKYDVLSYGVPFPLDSSKNYVKNADTGIAEIADLGDLTGTQVGFIGHATAIHKILLADRNISVLDEKKADKMYIGVTAPTDVYEGMPWIDNSGDSIVFYIYVEGAWIDHTAAAMMTPADILTSILTVDGVGSGLDSAFLEGNPASFFEPASPLILKDADIGVSIAAYDGTLEIGATADQDWGDIAGTLASQTDLKTALDALQPDGVTILNTTGGTIALTDEQAHFIAFDVKGVLTSNVVVTVPTGAVSAHLYVIDNATTGAFTCTAQVVGGAGIEVPQGVRYLMYSSGTKMEGITAVGGGGLPASLVVNIPQGNISGTDIQAVINELDTEKEPADSTILKDADIGVNVQAYDVVLDGTTASYTSAEKTKLGLLPSGYLGYYETEAALITAHPTGVVSEHATIGFTGTTWTWDPDAGPAAWIDTGNGSSGDMLAADYDPTSIIGDVFLRTNHTGTQLLSTISDSGNCAGLDTGTSGSTVALGNHNHSAVYEPLLGFTPVNLSGDVITGQLKINVSPVGDIPLILRNINATGASGFHMSDETDTVIAHSAFINTSRILAYNNLDAAGTIELQLNGVPKLTVETNGDITPAANIDGRDLSVDGIKLDLIEDLADVTDAVNVEAAGAVMDADIGVTVATQAHNHTGVYEPADGTILKDADIGVTVATQAHNHSGIYEPADGTILKDADIGSTVSAFAHNHSGVYEPADGTILKDADIGVTVQAYDITTLKDADIGSTVSAFAHEHIGVYEPADVTILKDVDIGINVASQGHNHTGVYEPANSTILKDADIGSTVAAESHNHSGVYEPADGTILKDADIGSTVQAYNANLQSLADNALPTNAEINAQTGTTYTLVAADNGKVITLSNAAAIAVTVPSGLGAGFNCTCIQIGLGQATFTGSGATVNNSNAHTSTSGQFAAATFVAYATNVFLMQGDTA